MEILVIILFLLSIWFFLDAIVGFIKPSLVKQLMHMKAFFGSLFLDRTSLPSTLPFTLLCAIYRDINHEQVAVFNFL